MKNLYAEKICIFLTQWPYLTPCNKAGCSSNTECVFFPRNKIFRQCEPAPQSFNSRCVTIPSPFYHNLNLQISPHPGPCLTPKVPWGPSVCPIISSKPASSLFTSPKPLSFFGGWIQVLTCMSNCVPGCWGLRHGLDDQCGRPRWKFHPAGYATPKTTILLEKN